MLQASLHRTASHVRLHIREALFAGEGAEPVGPISLDLRDAERLTLSFATNREASVAAMLAAAIVKPTAGSVLVNGFDSRIQPAACKRVAGYVPHDPLPLTRARFWELIAYRADLWAIDPKRARTLSEDLLARLAGIHEAFAYPLAAALVTSPQFLVLDRPQPSFEATIGAVAVGCAILTTRVSS